MKRMISLAIALLIGAVAAIGVSAGNKVDGRVEAEAYIADISADGKLEDAWEYAKSYDIVVIKDCNDTRPFYQPTWVSGVDYAKATFKVLWDGDDTLFVLMEVADKTPNSDYGADVSRDYFADSFEISFNLDNTTAAVAPTQWRWQNDGTTLSEGVKKFGFAKTSDGWILEASIDVSSVGGAGQYLGLDVGYNDNILGQKSRQVAVAWVDATNTSWKDSGKLGQVLLSTTKVADLMPKDTTPSTPATTPTPAPNPGTTTDPVPTPTPSTSPSTFDVVTIVAVLTAASGAAFIAVSKKR